MGNNGKNQFFLFDYYIMLLVTQTFVHFAYSKRKSITEEMGRNGEISFWRWYHFNSNIFITDYFDVENIPIIFLFQGKEILIKLRGEYWDLFSTEKKR